jgi:hypothetical protein
LDTEFGVVIAMDRKRLMQDNATRIAELRDDIERREMRYEPLERTPPVVRSQQPESQAQQQDWSAWNEWAEAHVARGLEALADTMACVVGEEVGTIERRLTERIEALEAEVGQLRAQQTVEAAAKVIDLPRLPLRTRDAA